MTRLLCDNTKGGARTQGPEMLPALWVYRGNRRASAKWSHPKCMVWFSALPIQTLDLSGSFRLCYRESGTWASAAISWEYVRNTDSRGPLDPLTQNLFPASICAYIKVWGGLNPVKVWNNRLFLTKLRWRRKWQPTAVFFPGEFLVQRNQVGHSL